MSQFFYFPGMKAMIESHVKTCEACQLYKITGRKKYGKVPQVTALRNFAPFEKVHVDLCGPFTVRIEKPDGTIYEMQVHFLSACDACTAWPELKSVEKKESKYISELFDRIWLCRYPRPRWVSHDNGTEFMGQEFQEMCESYGIKAVATTVKNPQAQSLVERMHLTLEDMLRTKIIPESDNWMDQVDYLLQTCAFSIRAIVSSNNEYSPAQLAFGVDMLFRTKVRIDWELLKRKRQLQAEQNNKKENKTRIDHVYKVGDKVQLLIQPYERAKRGKLTSPTDGVFTITKIFLDAHGKQSGTVRIQRRRYQEDISIRRLQPFYERTPTSD